MYVFLRISKISKGLLELWLWSSTLPFYMMKKHKLNNHKHYYCWAMLTTQDQLTSLCWLLEEFVVVVYGI